MEIVVYVVSGLLLYEFLQMMGEMQFFVISLIIDKLMRWLLKQY